MAKNTRIEILIRLRFIRISVSVTCIDTLCHRNLTFICPMYPQVLCCTYVLLWILTLYTYKEKQMKCNDSLCKALHEKIQVPGLVFYPPAPKKDGAPNHHTNMRAIPLKHQNLIPVVITSNAPLRKPESLLNLISNTLPPRHSRHAERRILLCRIAVRKLECTVFIFPLGLKTTRADFVANCAPKLTVVPVADLNFKSVPEGGRADLFACDLSVSKMVVGVGEWVVVVVCAVDIYFFFH